MIQLAFVSLSAQSSLLDEEDEDEEICFAFFPRLPDGTI